MLTGTSPPSSAPMTSCMDGLTQRALRRQARATGQRADRADGAEVLLVDLPDVDRDPEAILDPGEHGQHAEAVDDPVLEEVVVRVELVGRDVRRELVDDELRYFGASIHLPLPPLSHGFSPRPDRPSL